MQLNTIVPFILFLFAAFVPAFTRRKQEKVGVSEAHGCAWVCGCASLLLILVLGVLVGINRMPQLPCAIPVVVLAVIGIITGTLSAGTVGQYSGKGPYDFGMSLLLGTFFWIATSYLYFAVLHLSLQLSLVPVLIIAAFTAGEAIIVYWATSQI